MLSDQHANYSNIQINYGTADLSPAHALKSILGIEELAQATL